LGALAGAGLIGLVGLVGCTSSGSGAPSSAPPSASSPPLLSPAPAQPSSTHAPKASSTKPSAAKTTAAKPPPVPAAPACTSAHLKVAAVRGSGAAGQEFAVLTFTNTGAGACSTVGYPGVSLRLSGRLVGQPAQRSGQAHGAVTLQPGARAQAKIADFSSCQAPLSDKVRVYAPDQLAFADLPMVLRACHLVVGPITRG
jgi:hypothetical protein